MTSWKWFGYPGHFIGSDHCQFRMCTQVGDWLVSTVGDYRPKGANTPKVEIGCDRFFETFVFAAGAPCSAKDCGCGMPDISGHEVDSLPANTASEATANHLAMCAKYARKRARFRA